MQEKVKKRRFWILATVLLLFVASIGLLYFSRAPDTVPNPERRWRVNTLTVERGDYTPEVILFGEVYSPQRSTLAATLKDKIVVLPIREGDTVEKGQLLLALDRVDFVLRVSQRQAEFDRIEAERKAEYAQYEADKKTQDHLEDLVKTQKKIVDRFRKLYAQKHESEAQLDEALKVLYQKQIELRAQELAVVNHPNRIHQLEANLAIAKAELQRAKMDLGDTQVLAPFDGRIIEVLVAIGDDVADGQALLSLYNLNDVELRARLPSASLKAIGHEPLEKALSAVPMEYPAYTLPLLRSGAALATGDASINVFFKMPESLAKRLPLGYTLSVLLQMPVQKDCMRIPASALYGRKRIYQIVENHLKPVEVERVGEQFEADAHYYLIRSDTLPDGAQILKSKLPNARDGLKVEPV